MPAATIFAILLSLLVAVGVATAYSGAKTNEFNKRIVGPLKYAVLSLEKHMLAADSQTRAPSVENNTRNVNFSNNTVTVGSDVNVEINNNSSSSAKKTAPTYPTAPTTSPGTNTSPASTAPAFDDSAYKKAVADQQAWYQQQVDQMNKDSAAQNAQNKAAADTWYQQSIQQAQQAQQQWLKDHGF